jgi:hypothetical protein
MNFRISRITKQLIVYKRTKLLSYGVSVTVNNCEQIVALFS